jgi:hypothetical protein
VPNTFDNGELYDSIVLGGTTSPGKVTLSGHDRVIGWDVKKGSGQSGATTTRTSEDPIEFTCSFYLVNDPSLGIDDIAEWEDFATLIRSTVNGATPQPLDIYHPDLASNDITSVVLSRFGGVVHDGMGGQTVAVKFLEYRPPKPKGGTPKGSATKPKTATAPAFDPNAEANAELARLTNQYQRTPWG